MLLWDLCWWQIVVDMTFFGIIVYLIINAPISTDSTKKCDPIKPTPINYSPNKSTIKDESKGNS